MINLKIGRHTYDINENDLFMDNGSCVQLKSQSKEKSSWGHQPNPVLSKKAVKEISAYPRKDIPNRYSSKVSTFTLDLTSTGETV